MDHSTGFAGFGGGSFAPHELSFFYAALSPEYVVPAAIHHGAGNPVYGAQAAWDEASDMVRGYADYVLAKTPRFAEETDEAREKRIQRDWTFIVNLTAGAGQEPQRVKSLEDPVYYRQMMTRAARGRPTIIPGLGPWIVVPKAADREAVRMGVLRCVGRMLRDHPEWNRAVLPSPQPSAQVYRRTEVAVGVPVEFRQDDVSGIAVDPFAEDLRAHVRERFRGRVGQRRGGLALLGNQLLAAWLQHGFIASFAGAWVSDLYDGWQEWALPIFPEGAGVPITVVINPPDPGDLTHAPKVRLGVCIDHRALDGEQGREIHRYFVENLGACVEGEVVT